MVGVLWAARGRGKKEPDMTRQLWGSGSVGIRRGRRGSVEVWKWFSGNKKEGKSGGDGNGSSLSTQLWPDDNDVGNKSPTGGQS